MALPYAVLSWPCAVSQVTLWILTALKFTLLTCSPWSISVFFLILCFIFRWVFSKVLFRQMKIAEYLFLYWIIILNYFYTYSFSFTHCEVYILLMHTANTCGCKLCKFCVMPWEMMKLIFTSRKNVEDFTGPRERSDLGFITFDITADILHQKCSVAFSVGLKWIAGVDVWGSVSMNIVSTTARYFHQ